MTAPDHRVPAGRRRRAPRVIRNAGSEPSESAKADSSTDADEKSASKEDSTEPAAQESSTGTVLPIVTVPWQTCRPVRSRIQVSPS